MTILRVCITEIFLHTLANNDKCTTDFSENNVHSILIFFFKILIMIKHNLSAN